MVFKLISCSSMMRYLRDACAEDESEEVKDKDEGTSFITPSEERHYFFNVLGFCVMFYFKNIENHRLSPFYR